MILLGAIPSNLKGSAVLGLGQGKGLSRFLFSGSHIWGDDESNGRLARIVCRCTAALVPRLHFLHDYGC